MTTESQAAAQARAAKLQTIAVDRAAAELRAATETRTDEEAKAALKTVKPSAAEISSDIRRNRMALVETLDSIEDRLNVPKRFRQLKKDTKAKIHAMNEDYPLAVPAIGVGAAAVIGAIAWLGVRMFKR